MKSLRQKKMLDFIQVKGSVTVKELCALCPDVSLMTIHRDLDDLAKKGDIVRTHGGAIPVRFLTEPLYREREKEDSSGKRTVAEKALPLIYPGSTVFIDAGTTTLELAKLLPDTDVNIITSSPVVAMELCSLKNPRITVCCGALNKRNLALSGINTLDMLSTINIDIAFIGVSGVSAKAGLTCGNENEMLVKRTVIEKARTSICLCTANKFERLMPYTFAGIGDVNYIISDKDFPDDVKALAADTNVILL